MCYSNSNTGPSTPRSGDWDNYTEQPSFWNSRFGWIGGPQQIKLVDTESDSSSEFDPNLFGAIERLVEEKEPLEVTMSAEEKEGLLSTLKQTHAAIKAELALFTPEDLTPAAVCLLSAHFDSVKNLYVQMSSAFDDLEELVSNDEDILVLWKNKLNNIRGAISNNRTELMNKKLSFQPDPIPAPSPVITQVLAISALSSTKKIEVYF